MQIKEGLKLEKIKSVRINETHEPLVEIQETEKIKLLRDHKFLLPLVRKTVLEMIYKAADNLPVGYQLLIVTALRTVDMQQKLWDQRVWQMTKGHPFLRIFKPDEFYKKVRLYTSFPGGSPHHCGSAIDVTVIDPDGQRLDMGTSLTDFGPKVHMHNELITEVQRKNRTFLRETMTQAGFVYYPMEWWHYCYGDQMWAAYNGKKECIYGPIVK